MDEPTRRAWSKPEPIVLVRSGPEETVLGGCKTLPVGGGPSHGAMWCTVVGCTMCSVMSGS